MKLKKVPHKFVLIKAFESSPIIVKDYVKSQKHYWKEACFIPNASDKKNVESVIQKFIELQDSDLNEGLVFREFIELEKFVPDAEEDIVPDENGDMANIPGPENNTR